MTTPCTECGTPGDVRAPAPLASGDWRRWLWPALAVLWLIGMLVWSNRENWFGVRKPNPYPVVQMPTSTMARHLRTHEREGVRVWELWRLARHGGDGTLARSVLGGEFYFYSEHVIRHGRLALALDTMGTAMVGNGWAWGWPWGWAQWSEMVNYSDLATRERRNGPDSMPPTRILRPLRGTWTRYPAWGWESGGYDLAPVVIVLFLAWLAGRAAGLCARLLRCGEAAARRARWTARLGVVLLVLVWSAVGARRLEGAYAGATSAPILTDLTRAQVEALAEGPDGDRRVAEALLKVLPEGTEVGTYVLACTAMPSTWWLTSREWPVELPFVSVSEVSSAAVGTMPTTQLHHWDWMLWAVWNPDPMSLKAWSVQVYMDQMVYWLAPCWFLWAGGPAAVGLVRGWVARRRWRRGLCAGCGYPRPT